MSEQSYTDMLSEARSAGGRFQRARERRERAEAEEYAASASRDVNRVVREQMKLTARLARQHFKKPLSPADLRFAEYLKGRADLLL